MLNPAAMATQFTALPAVSAVPVCANTAGVSKNRAMHASITIPHFFIVVSPSYEFAARRWLPTSSYSRDHIGVMMPVLVLRLHRSRNVNHGQNCKNKRLQNCHKNMEDNENYGNKQRKDYGKIAKLVELAQIEEQL